MEIEFEEQILADLEIEHRQLVEQISKLDNYIIAKRDFIKHKEQEIVKNTVRIENLKTRSK